VNNRNNDPGRAGSKAEFESNWKKRPETLYTHWTRGEPENQIQLAFRQHWGVFSKIMREAWPNRSWRGLKALEIGAGRGTMSMYFADAGFDCTLIDSAAAALDRGKAVFAHHGLAATFIVGDALETGLPDASFDVIFSIGLLEHFENIRPPLIEQVRLLMPDGLFLGYVVPRNLDNVQKDYGWINELLRAQNPGISPPTEKTDVYRSSYPPDAYTSVLRQIGLRSVTQCGLYPLPMISPSIDFPFTLNPPEVEKVIVHHFESVLRRREQETGQPGWICDASYGQAFLVSGRKPSR
jgi:SAM-dependent methyltransferase